MKRMEYIRANEIMKREIKSVAMATLCCLMIFTSCAKTTRNVNNDEQVVSKELSTKDATGKDIPEWVKGSLGEGTLFEKVDITVSVNCLHRQSKYPCIKVPEGLMAFGHFFALGQIVARAKLNIGLFGNNTHGWLIRRPCVILYIYHMANAPNNTDRRNQK